MRARHQGVAGILLVLAAGACFTTLDTTAKYVGLTTSLTAALWLRYLFQALSSAAVALPLRGWSALRTGRPGFQLLRGALLMMCTLLAFASLQAMPVSEFTAIIMVTPLLITLLAATTLKERVSTLRWVLVAGGFTGTLIIIRPGADDLFDWATLLPLALVACNASFQILTARFAQSEDPLVTHLYTGWIGTVLATPLLLLPHTWPATPGVWLLTALMGLMGSIGHFLLIHAYARAPASTLTPYLYMQIAYAMLGGWLVFAHVPDRWSLVGIALVTACGMLGAWLTVRESRVPVQPVES